MLSILLNWLYTGMIVFVSGTAFLQFYDFLAEKVGGYHKDGRSKNAGYTFYSGIMLTTIYAQTFSVFYKVGLLANLILVVAVLIYLLLNRRYFCDVLKKIRSFFLKKGKGITLHGIILLAVIIIFAASGAGPAKLIDTDWYHAQTIRWIEEYGCVKGVANLFYALGFNNAQHYFDALFSMKSFLGQSLRGTGGFFGLIIFMHGFFRVLNWKQHKEHIGDVIALWEIVYSIIITAFFADPYVDTLPNGIVLFMMAEWFSMLEDGFNENFYNEKGLPQNTNMKWLAFCCILSVFAVVAKTSVITIVLVTFCPAWILIKNRKWKEIALYILLGFLVSLMYFVTNIITTGYPVYLFSALDFMDVEWKIDPSVLQYSVDNMIAFARMPSVSMEAALNMGLRWVPDWFMRESVSHKILYLAIVVIVIYDLWNTMKEVIFGRNSAYFTCDRNPLSDSRISFREKVDIWYLWPRLCIYMGLVYWFFTIPQVKYCWSFLILPIAMVPAYYYRRKQNGKSIVLRAIVLLSGGLMLMYGSFYTLRTVRYTGEGLQNNFVMQQDYENHVFNQVEKNGHTFYTRIDNGDIVCGYYIFPYLDNESDLDRLMVGKDLGEGFYFER